MGGLFALAAFLGYDPALRFYPHADGSFNTNLWVGNDFDVMEDYVCERLKSSIQFNKIDNPLTEDVFINMDNPLTVETEGVFINSLFSCGEVNVFE